MRTPFELPPFELLANQKQAYERLGIPLANSEERNLLQAEMVDQALLRLRDGFDLDASQVAELPSQIDRAVWQMWSDGWEPTRSFNLFATDFGLALWGTVHSELGGTPVFRSPTVLDHASLWWSEQKIEAFPFLHIAKVLCAPKKYSASAFFTSVASLVTTSKPVTLTKH